MLLHPVQEKLKELKFTGMLEALTEQMRNSDCQQLSFEERLGLLVDREVTIRENRRLQRRLRLAKINPKSCMFDIDYQQSRGLDKSILATLSSSQWIYNKRNVLIVGPTGTGKTFLGEALLHNACLNGHTAHSLRLTKFLNELILSKGDGRYFQLIKNISKFDVLMLDDFGIAPLSEENRHDLLEIIDDRNERKSTIITSQLPVKHWHKAIGDATLADAILDRLVHTAYRIELQGESMRKILSKNL